MRTFKGYKTGTWDEINIDGTFLQGYITTEYKKLKSKFGIPTKGDEYKTDAEWIIKFEDGSVATIYNYKDGKNYNGSSGIPKTKITEWHIGGRSPEVVSKIKDLLK